MEIQGSSSLARTTPSESGPLNLGGMVSRFFASSVYSNCPRKAKSHGLPQRVEEVQIRDLGWRGGRSPAIPVPVQRGPHSTPLSPTMQHQLGISPTGAFFCGSAAVYARLESSIPALRSLC